MIVDAHNHVNWWGYDAKALDENLTQQGIDRVWLLSWEAAPGEYDDFSESSFAPGVIGMPLADIWKACEMYPDRFIAGYCPDPRRTDATDALRHASAMGARICGEWKFRMPFDAPEAIALHRAAGELRMPVTLHLDVPQLPPRGGESFAMWYGGTWANLENALIACPDTIFLGHGPGFWRDLSADADERHEIYPEGPLVPGGRLRRLFESYDNLWADLSAGSALTAMRRDVDYTKEFLGDFYERILFGRDYFDGRCMEFLLGLGLPESMMRRIEADNALFLTGE